MPKEPDPSSYLALQIIIIFCLIFINAFLNAGLTAITSCSKNKIKQMAQDGLSKAVLLQKVQDEPEKIIEPIRIIILFFGFLMSAITATNLADDLSRKLDILGITYGYEISIVLVTLILIFVILVLSDLYPRHIAMLYSEGIALAFIGFLNGLSKLMAPFMWLLSVTVTLFLKITRQKVELEEDEFSEDEVMSMLEVGQETGVLKEEGKKMINSIFEFDDKLAYEIMTPRTDVFLIDANDEAKEYLDELMELRYSRIPVYEDDTDNIIGILNIKDYFSQARLLGFDNVDIKSILRKPYFVPETKNIDSLFINLQSTKNHIAILIDEYGGFSGIVTMEDIIEEVMGDIDDEYDDQELEIEKQDDGTYLIDGFATLHDINENLNLELDSDNSETIGGMLMDILGEIPDDNEHIDHDITIDNLEFRILSIKERRIEKVRLSILSKETIEDDNGQNK